MAGELPGDCLTVLELRLAPGPAPIDLSLRLTEAGHSRRLAERLPPSPLRSFLARWRDPDKDLAPVKAVWCEFDLDRDLRRLPAPVVSAKLAPEASAAWVVDHLVPALQGRALTAPRRRLVLACIDAMPPAAALLYVFDLRARETDAIRLEILAERPDDVLTHLRAVLPGATGPAAEVLEILGDAERLHVSYEVGDEVLPRIGIEGSFARLPRREPRWAALFDRLVARGLCSAGARDAALVWPGHDTFWTAPAAWPVVTLGSHGLCFRALSHVKVVCRPEGAPEAKVYLACGFSPSDQAKSRAESGSAAPGSKMPSSAASSSVRSS